MIQRFRLPLPANGGRSHTGNQQHQSANRQHERWSREIRSETRVKLQRETDHRIRQVLAPGGKNGQDEAELREGIGSPAPSEEEFRRNNHERFLATVEGEAGVS